MKTIFSFLIIVGILSESLISMELHSTTDFKILEPVVTTSIPEKKERDFLTYVAVGACGPGLPLLPEAVIGYRRLNTHHVLDTNMGVSPFGLFYYAQVSYLYFPKHSSGVYLGAGVTGGVSRYMKGNFLNSIPSSYALYGNIPFTLGYQMGSSEYHYFIQFQITPIFTTSVSYGIGF